MRARTRADVVGVYFPGEPIGNPTQTFIPQKEAETAVNARRAIWRDHRRKIRMFQHWRETDDKTIRDQRGTGGLSARPNAALLERYAAAAGSRNDAVARVAVDCWAGKVKSSADLVATQ